MRHTALLKDRYTPFIGRPKALARSVPASTGGWDAISNISAMPSDRAVVLDNFIPRPGYLEIRRGFAVWATGVGSGAVEAVMCYNGPTASKLFAAGNDGKIYDATAGGAASATTVTGLSSDRLQHINFTGIDGAHYLFTANGIDVPHIYNGTVWAATTINGVDFSQNSIIQFNGFKKILFGVLASSTKFIYGTIGQISGTFTSFDLGPLMTRGGYLVATATWSVDTRQTVDDYAAFITSRGQVIVYQGTDPSNPSTWALVSNFWIGPPIGQRCFLQTAGDLGIISIDGLLPLSQMLSTDRAASNRVSFTANIFNAMNDAARNYMNNFGWQIISYPRGTMAVMNIPIVENQTSYQFVMNTITGAWCRFTGINANAWETMNDNIYFGDNSGQVCQWDTGSGDGNNSITGTVETAFNYFGSRGIQKKFNMIRPILTTDGSVTPGVGINVDFGTGGSVSIPSTVSNASALWDSGVWNTSIWGIDSATVANWTTISGIGTCASVITTLSTSNNGLANGVLLRINSWDLNFEPSPGAGI